jgi:hypothetical protein
MFGTIEYSVDYNYKEAKGQGMRVLVDTSVWSLLYEGAHRGKIKR